MVKTQGYSLMELLLVVAILGILSTMGARLMIQVNRYFQLTVARTDLQKEARAAMYLISRNLRQAQAATIIIDRAVGQPFYSRITFLKIQGGSVRYYQNGNQLVQTVDGRNQILTKNLRYLAFSFPRSDDLSIVSVSMTLEKATYQGKKKALQMASERV